MVKFIFILVNTISLFLFSLFSADDVKIAHNIPASMKPGQEVNIEIKITKGVAGGFAKMQLEVPSWMDVSEIDSKGANFSYVEGTAKWVWANLPTEDVLVIKCSLKPSETASGKATIGGKYSFIENNAKSVVEMTPFDFEVSESAVVTNNTKPVETKSITASETNTTANTTNTTPEETPVTTTPVANSNTEPAGNITIKRTISKGGSSDEYVVNIKVEKGNTKGFARYSDDLPAGITAKAIKTEGASFSVADGKVKFVWVAVPEKEELFLAYSLSGITSPITLNGEYSFLEQNQSKKVNVTPEAINPEGPVANSTPTTAAAETTTTAANTPTGAVASNTTATDNSTANTNTTSTDNTANTNANTNTNPAENLTKREGNVNYMVQIGAFTNSNVSAQRLKNKFKISEKIQSEMQGGFSKFMVGSHGEYKSARDHREKVKNNNGVQSAFVVAYNTGKRITVQEALMISNQKWFK